MQITWSNAYKIGVGEIDYQHRRITEYIIQFTNYVRKGVYSGDGVELLMELLFEYLKLHFQDEENFLKAVDCPVSEKNKEENAKILNSISEFNSEYFNSSAMEEKKQLVIKLAKALEEWLLIHLCRMDLSLKNCSKCRLS